MRPMKLGAWVRNYLGLFDIEAVLALWEVQGPASKRRRTDVP
jgi:hypothetical protein